MRESCDSPDNPNSNAIIVGLDVSGSMGSVLNAIAQKLGVLVTKVYDLKPVSDPHLMFMGIDDVAAGDLAPLQVTQFEADIRIAEQLQKIYFEQGGGGNRYESYGLAHYFAGMHTRIDCWEKRKQKGFLFTIGDEEPTPSLTKDHIETVMGYKPQKDEYTAEELLELASRQYRVYHLMIEEGHNYTSAVVNKWTKLIGQRAIRVAEHDKVAEIIVSILQREAGESVEKIKAGWDKSTALVVGKAIDSLVVAGTSDKGGLVHLG